MPNFEDEELVTTGVDKLINYLKGKKPVTIKQASEYLGMPEKTVEEWVDFLVEEKIISVDYKFTTPYIYLKEDKKMNISDIRSAFEKNKMIDLEGIDPNKSWKENMTVILQRKRIFFSEEAKKRGLSNTQKLWDEYQERVIEKV